MARRRGAGVGATVRQHLRDRTLVLQVDPTKDLEVTVDAGSLDVSGVEGRIFATVNAGQAKIDGFRGPIELAVNAGSLRARGRLDAGESAIECNAGKVELDLEEGSSVRITCEGALNHADVPRQVGAGVGELDIVCNLGSVSVRSSEGSFRAAHRAW
jgi:hypothetical protein